MARFGRECVRVVRSGLLAATRVIPSIGFLGWMLGKVDATKINGSALAIGSGWLEFAVGAHFLQIFVLARCWRRVGELKGGPG